MITTQSTDVYEQMLKVAESLSLRNTIGGLDAFFKLVGISNHVNNAVLFTLESKIYSFDYSKNEFNDEKYPVEKLNLMLIKNLKENSASKKIYFTAREFLAEDFDIFLESCDKISENTCFFVHSNKESFIGVISIDHSTDTPWLAEELQYFSSVSRFVMSIYMASNITSEHTENEKTLERVLDSLDELIYVNDIHSNEVLFINKKMRETFDLSARDKGRCWEMLQVGMTDVCEFCPIHSLKSINDPPVVWREFNTKTQRTYLNTDRLIIWIDSRIVHIQHSMDITDLKKTEDELALAQETLKTVFDTVPSIIFWKNREGQVEGSNKQFEVLAANYDRYLQENPDKDDVSISSVSKVEDNLIFTGSVEMFDYEKQIGEKWFRMKKVPLRGENNKIVSVLVLLDDITRRKKDELLLIEKQVELEKAVEASMSSSKAKSDFLSRMSHEIRTPMNAIIGLTRIAQQSDDASKIKGYLDRVITASGQLLNIINDVLDMSKIEANKLHLSLCEFDLEKLLVDVADVVTVRSDEKNQELYFNLDRNIPKKLIGDNVRLAQVLTNILSNSVKFTREGGSISLAARLNSIDNDIADVEFIIKDNGIGITQEQMLKLFTAFEQADGSISRRFGGTGLGLVICKNIVEMMGGKIKARSDGSSFSEFIFNVKLTICNDGQKYSMRKDFSNVSVLFVDDDAISREIFDLIASRLSLNVSFADSGKEAIELSKISKFDIAFVDYVMPDLDGVLTINSLKHMNQKCKYVLISSAYSFTEITGTLEQIGVNSFISKPLFDSTVLNILNRELPSEMLKVVSERSETSNLVEDFTGKRLLLAEDSEVNRMVVIGLLKSTNIEIIVTTDGVEALEVFSNDNNIDIIFMDIHMPRMNGYETSLAIRNLDLPNAESVPIIAVTADVFADDVKNCYNSKMNGHIGKPITYSILIDILNKFLVAKQPN